MKNRHDFLVDDAGLAGYIKAILKKRRITTNDAAGIFNYEPQSMRNKFSKHSFNLRDVIISCVINDCELVIRNKRGEDEFIFEPSEDIVARLKNYRCDKKYSFENWISLIQRKHLCIAKLKNVLGDDYNKKKSENETKVESNYFKEQITIVGERCNEAAREFEVKSKDAQSAEKEWFNVLAIETFYDVYFAYGDMSNCYVLE